MQQALLAIQSPYVLFGLCGITLLTLVYIIVLHTQLNRLRKRMNRFFMRSEGDNLEETLNRLLGDMDTWEGKLSDQQFIVNRLSQKMSTQAGNVAVHRYNAFGEMGSDLSFSLAFLDEQENGVVITSIYGREESRTYAKPIEKGTSVYHLSEEEQMVIKKATTSSVSVL